MFIIIIIIILYIYNYCGGIHHRIYIIVNIYIRQETFLFFTCLQVTRLVTSIITATEVIF